jgi:uncharacterized membrane protein
VYFYIWFFFIYAFLGWCTEVAYTAFNSRKFVNRGFLNGPICPIYGVGVAIIIACLTPFEDYIILSFLGSVVLISTLELVTGWFLEKMFHQKWWDYSDMPLNINGYICLKFSLMWGFVCVLIINMIHPIIYNIITLIPVTLGKVILVILLAGIIVDMIVTIQSVINLNKFLKQLSEIASKIRSFSEEFGEIIASGSISLMEKSEDLKNVLNEGKSATGKFVEEQMDRMDQGFEKAKEQILELEQKRKALISKGFFGGKRLLQAFPRIKSKHYREVMEELKEKILKH